MTIDEFVSFRNRNVPVESSTVEDAMFELAAVMKIGMQRRFKRRIVLAGDIGAE